MTVLLLVSCDKEYSFENGTSLAMLPDTSIKSDTIQPQDTIDYFVMDFPSCAGCTEVNQLPLSTWSFKTGNSFVCGEVDTAILNYERTAFTFFGPSFCAADTGLIFTVYLSPFKLDHDVTNLKVPYAAFYYYHTGYPNILTNKTNLSFDLTITSYSVATKIAVGTFSGVAYTGNDKPVKVFSGKYKIKLL